jgi:hypothetical protein
MGIASCRLRAFVPQHHLNGAQFVAKLKQVSEVGVPQFRIVKCLWSRQDCLAAVIAAWTPPRSIGLRAVRAEASWTQPLGKSRRGLRCAPEAAQDSKGGFRQRHKPILAALAWAHMHPPVGGINIANLQAEPFPKAQAHAVHHKEVNAVEQTIDTVDQQLHFLPCGNIL